MTRYEYRTDTTVFTQATMDLMGGNELAKEVQRIVERMQLEGWSYRGMQTVNDPLTLQWTVYVRGSRLVVHTTTSIR